jgi:hypothetical protein
MLKNLTDFYIHCFATLVNAELYLLLRSSVVNVFDLVDVFGLVRRADKLLCNVHQVRRYGVKQLRSWVSFLDIQL